MKSIISYLPRWLLFLTVVFFYGCTDLELNEKAKLPNHDIDMSSRAVLSKKLRDSTANAESLVLNSFSAAESGNSQRLKQVQHL